MPQGIGYKTPYAPQITTDDLFQGVENAPDFTAMLRQRTKALENETARRSQEISEQMRTLPQAFAESGNQDVLDRLGGPDKALEYLDQFNSQASQAMQRAKDYMGETQQKVLDKAYEIGTRFGARQSADVFSGGVNYGLDVKVPEGAKVALPEGEWEILEAFNDAKRGFIGNSINRGYGNSVLARNRQTGETIRLSHLKRANAQKGQVLPGGAVIGLSGSTGNSTGPHLDIEYRDAQGRLGDFLRSPYASYLL